MFINVIPPLSVVNREQSHTHTVKTCVMLKLLAEPKDFLMFIKSHDSSFRNIESLRDLLVNMSLFLQFVSDTLKTGIDICCIVDKLIQGYCAMAGVMVAAMVASIIIPVSPFIPI